MLILASPMTGRHGWRLKRLKTVDSRKLEAKLQVSRGNKMSSLGGRGAKELSRRKMPVMKNLGGKAKEL